ncbi:MAG: asparaginase [Acidaminococcaceae bacterium]
MKKVVVITTGGTIAMKYDSVTKGLVPAVSGEDLIEAVPELADVAEVEVVEFSNMPSGHITPGMMFELAKMTDRYAARDDVSGVVITHGTDTQEETVYLLSLVIETIKPVCITGAMRGASEMGPDGPANILAAVKVAACEASAGRGALLVFNDEIHAAAEVTKTHSTSCSTFASPGWGPIGHVYFDKVIFKRQPENLQKIKPEFIEEDVCLIKTAAGMDDYLFKCLATKPVKGIVVEALGCGNVPLGVKKGIEYVRSCGIPVVLATRVHSGRVVPAYSYEGSALSMAASNVVLAGELTGQKARIKLMLVLAITKDVDLIKKYFD